MGWLARQFTQEMRCQNHKVCKVCLAACKAGGKACFK